MPRRETPFAVIDTDGGVPIMGVGLQADTDIESRRMKR